VRNIIIINYGHIFEKTFKIKRKKHSLLIILIISAIFETTFEYIIFIFQEIEDALRKILLLSLIQTNIINGLKQKRTRN
jgi:hypothetical protein